MKAKKKNRIVEADRDGKLVVYPELRSHEAWTLKSGAATLFLRFVSLVKRGLSK